MELSWGRAISMLLTASCLTIPFTESDNQLPWYHTQHVDGHRTYCSTCSPSLQQLWPTNVWTQGHLNAKLPRCPSEWRLCEQLHSASLFRPALSPYFTNCCLLNTWPPLDPLQCFWWRSVVQHLQNKILGKSSVKQPKASTHLKV